MQVKSSKNNDRSFFSSLTHPRVIFIELPKKRFRNTLDIAGKSTYCAIMFFYAYMIRPGAGAYSKRIFPLFFH